ncbi:sulfatase [Pelagicoccus mobilis]|uniref:Sulfatase n=1 Tax=Pelagicoccus mobilis TaxID=415221 RepID=A0A934VR43_9BACT|nr:sulfatase [Pelagicoccus mobilis]MBK1877223.1 sulfatase [Pelagicoccus mobilis]
MNTRVLHKLSIAALFCFQIAFSAVERPNVLFIAVDDLKPELGCYGASSSVKSPNIDRLASRGTIFERAYCSIPVCGASRASLLTGMYPLPDRFITYNSRVDIDAPGVVTLPEQFKKNGYFTTQVGKVFHDPDDAPQSWSEPSVRPDFPNSLEQQEAWRDYRSPENEHLNLKQLPLGAPGPAWEAADIPDNGYYDGKTADMALAKLDTLAGKKEPFFLGVGFIRPHLPFNAPKKYWDLYGRAEITLAENSFLPDDMPRSAFFNSNETRNYTNIPDGKTPIDEGTAINLRHGYYACVSYVDTLIGRILDRLERLELADNTIIVLWGDHGWSLGEHTFWGKHTNFDDAMRSPLIVCDPRKKQGKKSQSLVSFVDIYPSLCDLAGIPLPEHLDGKSFARTLTKPKYAPNPFVFCRWQEGETVIDGRYNYTRFFDKEGEFKEDMLYDHKKDRPENRNVAAHPEYKPVVERLAALLGEHLEARR